ncbi:GTP-binding protein EngA [Acetobacter nitrogenifigens DSM 23921 = NBRC 105050]|uniref:GTPase Der n=1 Tax=Acetobacter nitrogenifigens DSM 23921 = NBRC 105050 TaxID=1120919 RepID=A0A511X5P4_9PROT|nr:ribosome biogenesis GTPase Der [Acetobacter nitrogenifigens]GBQ98312.1 GTP-binding protein EngA [Acetobacter nitrogenifigens DSM 23921 = NBRC 105050]GEN58235.1 GTPase Der [Acetobacter nitrogenifigens DSM 23921 = NBRC 105050]
MAERRKTPRASRPEAPLPKEGLPTVVIAGRPNVGKSTLFNRLVGRRQALVADQPGVTRDRKEGEAMLRGRLVRLIDTAGLEEAAPDTLYGRMRASSESAVQQADLVLFCIDARAGITPADAHFASWLRRQNRKVILVANKAEGRSGAAAAMEAFSLGLGDPLALSAEHGDGIADLMGEIAESLPPMAEAEAAEAVEPVKGSARARARAAREAKGQPKTSVQPEPEVEVNFADILEGSTQADADDPMFAEFAEQAAFVEDETAVAGVLKIAFVGRPNAGKSTLLNRVLGEERMITGPEPGLTRDSIAVMVRDEHGEVQIVDTAGLRRKARIDERLEKMSTSATIEALKMAEVVVLVIDATLGLHEQDLQIARLIEREGRGCVLALNKWDAVEDRVATRKAIYDRLEISLTQMRGIEVVSFSATTGAGVNKLLPAVRRTAEIWNTRVSTGELNRWFDSALERHAPPLVSGRRLKLRYITQVKSRPPTFLIFGTRAEQLPDDYRRYLVNGLRESFGLDGVPIRLQLRGTKNPYADENER